ncbi:MAG TPA: hypothetical protein VK982_00480, partial [Bacteroidales bacterium]|nr:hypothetical protein [Bacteroidales bacterium]
MSNEQKNSISKKCFEKIVADTGYKLLSSYKNNKVKVELECPNGHKWTVRPFSFKNGSRCPECRKYDIKMRKGNEFREFVNDNGHKLLSGYKNAKEKVLIRCNNGHEYEIKPNDFKSGIR